MANRHPFEDIERMFGLMSQQFGSELVGVPTDVIERGEQFVVLADLPGYDSDDVEVRLTDGRQLEIRAQRDGPADVDGRFVQRERTDQSASRTVTLPESVEASDTDASYDDGVLEITLTKETTGGNGRDIPVN